MSYLDTPNDIFVSYAHDDDRLDLWVSKLVRLLKEQVVIDLKNREGVSDDTVIGLRILHDHEITKVGSISARLRDEVGKSAVLLVVVSDSYLNSDWCQREGDWFQAGQRDREDLRIVIVEKSQTDRDRWPVFLRDHESSTLFAHEFFDAVSANDTETLDVTDEDGHLHPKARQPFKKLANDVATVLSELKRAGPDSPRPPALQAQGAADAGTVFVALTADDLTEYERAELVDLLRERGATVLPDDRMALPVALAPALESMRECELFVQLLGRSGASIVTTEPTGGLAHQATAAHEAGLPTLHWLAAMVKVDKVPNAAYREFLESEAIAPSSEEMPALADRVLEALRALREAPLPGEGAAAPTKRLLALHWDVRDAALAESVRQEIQASYADGSVVPVLPPIDSEWEDRKGVFQECDGMLVIWGDAGTRWVMRQIRNVIPDLHLAAEGKPAGLANFNQPPVPVKLGFDPSDAGFIRVLEFTDGVDANRLREFCSPD